MSHLPLNKFLISHPTYHIIQTYETEFQNICAYLQENGKSDWTYSVDGTLYIADNIDAAYIKLSFTTTINNIDNSQPSIQPYFARVDSNVTLPTKILLCNPEIINFMNGGSPIYRKVLSIESAYNTYYKNLYYKYEANGIILDNNIIYNATIENLYGHQKLFAFYSDGEKYTIALDAYAYIELQRTVDIMNNRVLSPCRIFINNSRMHVIGIHSKQYASSIEYSNINSKSVASNTLESGDIVLLHGATKATFIGRKYLKEIHTVYGSQRFSFKKNIKYYIFNIGDTNVFYLTLKPNVKEVVGRDNAYTGVSDITLCGPCIKYISDAPYVSSYHVNKNTTITNGPIIFFVEKLTKTKGKEKAKDEHKDNEMDDTFH